jgi:hypothetical protein
VRIRTHGESIILTSDLQMEHREDWQGLPKYGGGRARQDSGSAPMLMWAASMAAYNVNMYVGFVCVCTITADAA